MDIGLFLVCSCGLATVIYELSVMYHDPFYIEFSSVDTKAKDTALLVSFAITCMAGLYLSLS